MLSGIELALGRAQPYLDAWFWGPIHAMDGEVELVAGLKFRSRAVGFGRGTQAELTVYVVRTDEWGLFRIGRYRVARTQ